MNLTKWTKLLVVGVLFALALNLGGSAFAADLSEPVRARLTEVAEMRTQGKAAEAVLVLEQAAKDNRQDPAGTAAMQYVLAQVYVQDLKDEKKAKGVYDRLALGHTAELDIPGVGTVNVQQEALKYQNSKNQGHWLYKVMAGITGVIGNNPVTGRALAGHSGVIAIFLLTVAIKLLLTPLTVKSFRSMREMQKLQPLMKDLQQRYKDKPQELNKRMMDLYKEHGVNPLSGCLPMLLQMPIIVLLWRAIALYQYPLSQESFIWIPSLAAADLPLALIYAGSLYLSSKLTVMPTADPAQQQQQKMMAFMMPVMFFFLFKSYPAGFILGWLFFNVLTTAQQWHIMRGHGDEDAGNAIVAGGSVATAVAGGNNGAGRKPAARPGGASQSQSARTIKRKRGR